MQFTFEDAIQVGKAIIAECMNGKASVVAFSLRELGWVMPTSCPYLDNTDRFNCPIYANDNRVCYN